MRANLIKTNFTAGEISPRLMGRVDIARYQNGAKRIENAVCVIHGGVMRRPGTRYAAAAKYGDRTARLIPYVFNRQQAYMLEFGDGYVRFYQDGQQIGTGDGMPYEIVSPYTLDMLDMLTEVNYVQGADTMFLVHQSLPPHRLQRKEHNLWVLEPIDFTVEPFDEIRDTPEKWCKPSVKEFVGSAITLTLSDTEPTEDDPGALTGTGWVAEDIGSYIRINSGLVLIESVTSGSVAVGVIRANLSATQAASPGAWTRNDSVWTEELGYPGAVTLYLQRLVLAGTPSYPQKIWMSEVGITNSFELSTDDDDDAFDFTVSSDQINPIVHMTQMNTLIALTFGGEFTLSGSAGAVMAPTNPPDIKNPSPYGCRGVRPTRVGTELMFVQRAGRKLMAVAYDPDSYVAYAANDLSILSEHITKPYIVDMSYQQESESFMWLVRADGVLLTMAIDRAQEVTAWTRQITDGAFESVASIPSDTADVVYVLVKREVNGETVRYVEVLDPTMSTDAGTTGTSNVGSAIWEGLDHLEGKTVDIVADGSVMPQQIVADGQVTLNRTAKSIEIGLHYDTTIETLTTEISTNEGTVQGTNKRTSQVTLRFLETTGAELNGQVIPFRTFGKQILDAPAPLFTGDHFVGKLGWERGEDTLVIQQRQPLPFHLLAVIYTFTSNGGS